MSGSESSVARGGVEFPLPELDRERVAEVLAGTRAPATPRDAASVVLIRDADHGPEVYLMRRVAGMAFGAGMHVFPGGGLDTQDGELAGAPWVGPAPGWWARQFGADPELAARLVVAAIRETFEECGVLLAGLPEGQVLSDTSGPEWELDRQAVDARECTLAQVLRSRDLVLRTDLLMPLAHWITPVTETRRYDTRFFLAALPAGQVGRDAGTEADHRVWVRPADALSSGLALLPPTRAVLTSLADYPDVAAAMQDERVIRTVQPRATLLAEGTRVRLVRD